jgi:hypothetical protein
LCAWSYKWSPWVSSNMAGEMVIWWRCHGNERIRMDCNGILVGYDKVSPSISC